MEPKSIFQWEDRMGLLSHHNAGSVYPVLVSPYVNQSGNVSLCISDLSSPRIFCSVCVNPSGHHAILWDLKGSEEDLRLIDNTRQCVKGNVYDVKATTNTWLCYVSADILLKRQCLPEDGEINRNIVHYGEYWMREKLNRLYGEHDYEQQKQQKADQITNSVTYKASTSGIYRISGYPLEKAGLDCYIGQAVRLSAREKDHLSGNDDATKFLIETIIAKGCTPRFDVIKFARPSQLDYEEKRWYDIYKKGGWNLWNKFELTKESLTP